MRRCWPGSAAWPRRSRQPRGWPEVVKLEAAMRTLEHGREEQSLQQAQRMLRKAVHPVALVDPMDVEPAAAHAVAVQAENDVKGDAHPAMRYARGIPTVLAAIDVGIK